MAHQKLKQANVSLYAGHNHLTLPKVPPDLFWLRLTALYLNRNEISRVPDELFELKHLVWLDLQSNELESVPERIGGMRQLRQLNIAHNRLRDLPCSIANLTQLHSLDLSGNTALPSAMNRAFNGEAVREMLGEARLYFGSIGACRQAIYALTMIAQFRRHQVGLVFPPEIMALVCEYVWSTRYECEWEDLVTAQYGGHEEADDDDEMTTLTGSSDQWW